MDAKLPGALLAVLMLAACAATPFQPRDDRGYGYGEQQLAPDVYAVAFLGNSATPLQQVCDFASLRAAQLGMSQGFAYLRILDDQRGMILLRSGRGGSTAYPENSNPQVSSRMDGGPSMTYGTPASYGSSLNIGGKNSGGTPAYACLLKVQFSAGKDDDAGHPAQALKPLRDSLSTKYTLPSSGG